MAAKPADYTARLGDKPTTGDEPSLKLSDDLAAQLGSKGPFILRSRGWELLSEQGLPTSRHTYARWCAEGRGPPAFLWCNRFYSTPEMILGWAAEFMRRSKAA